LIKGQRECVTYLLPYSSVVRPSKSLGLPNYRRPFFPIDYMPVAISYPASKDYPSSLSNLRDQTMKTEFKWWYPLSSSTCYYMKCRVEAFSNPLLAVYWSSA